MTAQAVALRLLPYMHESSVMIDVHVFENRPILKSVRILIRTISKAAKKQITSAGF